MIIRAIAAVAFWLLAVVTAFYIGLTIMGALTGSTYNQFGYMPFNLAACVGLAIPTFFLGRFLLRR